MDRFRLSSRVLVISPHPDDEAIGCGGTIRNHVTEGDCVHVIFLTSGENGGHGRSPADTIVQRERESEAARRLLGISEIEFYREPDGGLQPRAQVVRRIAEKLQSWAPTMVYVTHGKERHPDHRAATRIVRAACRKAAVPEVWMYEVWTPLERMDKIVDITSYAEAKRQAIRAYESQCAVLDFEAAILGLNRYRGEMFCWPEGEYAEVFTRMHTETK